MGRLICTKAPRPPTDGSLARRPAPERGPRAGDPTASGAAVGATLQADELAALGPAEHLPHELAHRACLLLRPVLAPPWRGLARPAPFADERLLAIVILHLRALAVGLRLPCAVVSKEHRGGDVRHAAAAATHHVRELVSRRRSCLIVGSWAASRN
eukprot:CAMPEP_0170254226 /NCGR_PEP_ID=MMETSP0116_2-20130129/26958_1 /TAXON_ID=400756 /ORGANISM="Durinskia baltica, Strain CSIRO CS-38" /LENGTH=155 /DNA_ID=CAMNT_0010505219 /DNA_START=35 /DNA_END=499 /DNA_ORIENTATION=+